MTTIFFEDWQKFYPVKKRNGKKKFKKKKKYFEGGTKITPDKFTSPLLNIGHDYWKNTPLDRCILIMGDAKKEDFLNSNSNYIYNQKWL